MTSKCAKCGNTATRKFEIGSDEGFILCCDDKKCSREIGEEIYNTYYMRFNQGRKYSSYRSSADIIYYSVIVMGIILLGYTIIEFVKNFV